MKKENCETLENPMYHDTWILLKKYRDVVWSLELSVQRVRRQFQIEYGSSIEEFLESIYLAGVDFADSGIEEHAQSIERSHKMLKLVESSVELLRNKHKHGEDYYWLLYYSFLSPQQYRSAEEIIEQLKPHIRDISYRTYYRKRKEATLLLCPLSCHRSPTILLTRLRCRSGPMKTDIGAAVPALTIL